MSNRAWVTLATNDSYGLGALVLAHSLRRANTAHPAVVLITPSVTEAMRNRLSAVFAEVITVNVLDSQDAAHLALLQRPELGITFTKIHCWTLTQYQKCVFLDADTLIVQNCDELFERDELSAAPDVGWPDCFNSGVFVFVPSQETYSRLITFAQERGSFDGGDQGLLNAFFADWAHGDIKKHLPFLYNVTSAAFYSYIPALKHYGQDLKIIHFIGAAKPWLQQFNWQSRSVDAPEHLKQFLQLWWDLFVSQVHSQLDSAMESAVDEEQGPLEPPPENPPEDSQHHYAPEITADSEFPWHWPENSIQETEYQEQNENMIEIHDPWRNYRGTIPPKQDYSSQRSDFGGVQNEEEIRKYAWEYQESYDKNAWQQKEHFKDHDHHSHHRVSDTQHHTHQFQHHEPNSQYDNHQMHQYQNVNTHYQHQENQSHHQDAAHSWQNLSYQNNTNFNIDGSQKSIEHHAWHIRSQHNQSRHEHSYSDQISHQSFQSHQSNDYPDSYSSDHHSYTQESHTHNYQIDIHQQQHDQNHSDYSTGSHTASGDNSEVRFSRQHNGYKHFIPYINQIIIDQVYHVHLDHHPRRNRRSRRIDCDHVVCANGFVNGHNMSDSESEEEYIVPRHPYDGFYLRHRPTIDPRGRKICTHEIPPTPLPSPPPEEPSSIESSAISSEDYDTASECEDQYSGVAGNLARVVPGSSSHQSEAIDELTRRQGWEAGNIDYMGADSFDNIWAKISQTLSQQPPKQPSPPRKEPTPPKEPSPPKQQTQPEAAPKPVEQPAPATTSPVTPEAAPPQAPKTGTPASPPPEAPKTEAPAPAPAPAAPAPIEVAKPVKEALATEPPKEQPTQKTEATVPPTPPATPKSTPEATSPVTESAPEVPKAAACALAKPASSAVAAEAPAVPAPEKPTAIPEKPAATPEKPVAAPEKPVATPEKPQDSSVTTTSSTDSPPLANTPSKDDPMATVSPTKSEERRKPVEKLQLRPPAAADPLPTPDSELEDAAALAHAIIASELSTSVTASTPAADVSPPPPLEEKCLSVEAPELPTPPVSLAQIGVKPKGKPTTAAQIESSISPAAQAPATPETPASPAPAASESSAPATPTSATAPATPSEAGKKKTVKKVTKKEAGPGGDTPTPVPPPRKKEKKPKEK